MWIEKLPENIEYGVDEFTIDTTFLFFTLKAKKRSSEIIIRSLRSKEDIDRLNMLIFTINYEKIIYHMHGGFIKYEVFIYPNKFLSCIIFTILIPILIKRSL